MKRFTETTKWKDPWFRKLPNDYKLLWIWLCDECDNAGVWTVCKEDAEYHVKKKIDWEKVMEFFENKVIPFGDGEEKWLIKNFIIFQHGQNLSTNNPYHRQILALKDKYQLDNILKGVGTPCVGAAKPLKYKNKDRYKDKEVLQENYINEIFPSMKHIKMTKGEYEKLIQWRNKKTIDEEIINMELWCGSHGKKYKNYYYEIMAWIRRNEKRQSERNKTDSSGNRI